MNALGLNEFNILKTETNDYDYLFTVEKAESPTICPKCGHMNIENKPFWKHNTKERTLSDISMHGKRVKLLLRHVRYKCQVCEYTFYELLDSVDTNDKITKRLYLHIQQQALKKPFTTIADEFGISNMTVRRAFDDFVKDSEKHRVLKAPRVIGIDEAHLNKVMRGVITDIDNRRILEILPTNLKRDVKACIKSMEGYKDIEVATMDMATGYRYAMQELVPNALCIIDKFHVIQLVTRALDSVRINFKNSITKQQKKLLLNDRWLLLSNQEDLSDKDIVKRDAIFKIHPELLLPYHLKEGLRVVYRASDRKDAYERYYEWEKAIPDDLTAFKGVADTINGCKTEVFNYFLTETKYTNAYTESINNIIKKIEKSGVGYSFEVLRAKVLYGTTATKKPEFGENLRIQLLTPRFLIKWLIENQHLIEHNDDEKKLLEGQYVDVTELMNIINKGIF
ncbi:MAG: ISL3 family transposase [Bacteroidota bacterium]|nr:ISL3 family transposase [Bacteroidota bacterium]